MKRALPAFLIVSLMFAAPPVMTNQTIEAMVYRGVPLPAILEAIRKAARIQLSETRLDYDRLIAAGCSPAAAAEIMKAVHYRQFVGIDNHPVKTAAPAIQTTPTPTPEVPEVPSVTPSALVKSGDLKPETAASVTARTLPAITQEEEEKAPPVDKVGVYYESGEGWTAIPTEMVNWKTGGVLKSLGTLGVFKGDMSGELRNVSSKTHLGANVQLLVFAPKGVAVDEYQLFRLHVHSDSREFRAVTGRVFHVSGGAERDTLEFEGIQVAAQTWTINLGSLPRGEYGLLLTRASGSLSEGAELGKMYTFSTSD